MAAQDGEASDAEAVEAPAKLTIRQEKFAQAYVELGNASEAYRVVYGAENYAPESLWPKASALLNSHKVRVRVDQLKADALARHQITADRTIAELGRLGFSNMQDYVVVQADGSAYVDLTKVTPEQFAAISEITVDTYTEGKGEAAREVKRVKVKLSDKRGALSDLSEILGLKKHKHEITGKDGVPLAPETSTRELARAVLDIFRSAQVANNPAPADADDESADDNPSLDETGGPALRSPSSDAAGVRGRSPAASAPRKFDVDSGELE